jgi:hypothetical protein
MFPRVLQVFTLQRAMHRLFAFGSAANRTNIAAYAGAIPAGLARLTDLTEYSFDTSIVSSGLDATS